MGTGRVKVIDCHILLEAGVRLIPTDLCWQGARPRAGGSPVSSPLCSPCHSCHHCGQPVSSGLITRRKPNQPLPLLPQIGWAPRSSITVSECEVMFSQVSECQGHLQWLLRLRLAPGQNVYDSEQTSKRSAWPMLFSSLSFTLDHCHGLNHCFLYSTPLYNGVICPPSVPCDFAVLPMRMAWGYFPTALMLGLAMWFLLTHGYEPKPQEASCISTCPLRLLPFAIRWACPRPQNKNMWNRLKANDQLSRKINPCGCKALRSGIVCYAATSYTKT